MSPFFFCQETNIHTETQDSKWLYLTQSKRQSPYKDLTGLTATASVPPLTSLTLASTIVLSHILQPPLWPPCRSSSTSVILPARGLCILFCCRDKPQISMGLPTSPPSDFYLIITFSGSSIIPGFPYLKL